MDEGCDERDESVVELALIAAEVLAVDPLRYRKLLEIARLIVSTYRDPQAAELLVDAAWSRKERVTA
jgi:hypothetical protein